MSRVERLVAEDLNQGHQAVRVVLEESLGHRVAKQVRMDLHSDDRGALVAKRVTILI